MKKILIGLLAVVLLVVAAVIAAAFLAPTDFGVERETTINKPREEVYEYSRMLKNQNDWGPWFKKEPTMKQEFRGTDGEVGFVSHWSGTKDEVGEGEQEIKRLVPNERIETELRFMRPFESKADSYMTFETLEAGQTKVKWGFTGSMPRPMNLMMLAMDMDAAIGNDFSDGLGSLKAILESR